MLAAASELAVDAARPRVSEQLIATPAAPDGSGGRPRSALAAAAWVRDCLVGRAVPRPGAPWVGCPVGRPDRRGARHQPDRLGPAHAAGVVGLDNFAALLSDHRFLIALRNTVFFTVTSVPIGLAPRPRSGPRARPGIRGIAIIRTAYFLPVVTSTTAIALVWLWIYSPQGGLLNELLGVFGIPPRSGSATRSGRCRPSCDERLAGPGRHRDHLPGRAPGDPAGVPRCGRGRRRRRWARFRHVTLPLLTPSHLLHRDPRLHRRVPGLRPGVRPRPARRAHEGDDHARLLHLRVGLQDFKMGYAAAASWILFLIVAALTILYFRSQRRWVHYQ